MSLANEKTLSTRVQVITRSKGGNAVRAAAYRSGSEMTCERTAQLAAQVKQENARKLQEALATGEKPELSPVPKSQWDFENRQGVEAAFIMAPAGAPAWALDRSALWNRVEHTERRKDAQLARELRVSLPLEFTAEQREKVARQVVQSEFVEKGMVADVAIHLYGHGFKRGAADTAQQVAEWQARGYAFLDEKASAAAAAEGQARPHVMVRTDRAGQVKDYRLFQPHFHAMMTLRPLAPNGQGFASKIAVRDDWNTFRNFDPVRDRITALQNAELEQSGALVRFDHRSYEERKVDATAKAEAARVAGRPDQAALYAERAREFARRATPYMGLSYKLKELRAAATVKFSQWVAARHANKLHAQFHAIEDRDPVAFVTKAQQLLQLAARGLGLKPLAESQAERDRELGLEHG